MEIIKTKLPLIFAIIMFLALCGLAFYCVFIRSIDYYTCIDNAAVQEVDNGDYEYKLRAYDTHGKIQEVDFKANKKLRDGAYLKLETKAIRGVVFWEEVGYDELPQDVRFRYQENN